MARNGDAPAWAAWTENSQLDPASDLKPASTTSSPHPPPCSFVELLIASPAGKPVAHFTHGHARHDPSTPFTRAPAERAALAATAVAFAAVAPDVRTISTPEGAVYFASTHSLHVAVVSAEPSLPESVLASLARLAVAFLTAVLSANLVTTLRDRPGFDITSHLDPFMPHLHSLLSRALAHPFPYAALAPVSLPCPTSPTSRSALGELLGDAVQKSSRTVTHALLVTACAPYPRKIVAVAEPSAAQLTPLDLLVLTSMLPDETSPPSPRVSAPTTPSPPLPSRYFLQTNGHAVPYAISFLAVELRLRPDDYESFEAIVGTGNNWRPEWGASGGDVVWAVVLANASRRGAEAEAAATSCAKLAAAALKISRASRDLIIAMERPWFVSDVPALGVDTVMRQGVRGVVVLSQRRCAATVGACEGVLGAALAFGLERSGWASLKATGSGNSLWHVVDEVRGFRVVGMKRRILVLVERSVGLTAALDCFVQSILPWEERYRASLLSGCDRTLLPSRTMFGSFLAPFPGEKA